MCSKLVACSRQSKYAPGETLLKPCSPTIFFSNSAAMRSGSRNGSGRSSRASTTLKIAVFAPRPSARTTTAVMANPGVLRNWRREYRKSWASVESIAVGEGTRMAAQIAENVSQIDRAWDGVSECGQPCRAG